MGQRRLGRRLAAARDRVHDAVAAWQQHPLPRPDPAPVVELLAVWRRLWLRYSRSYENSDDHCGMFVHETGYPVGPPPEAASVPLLWTQWRRRILDTSRLSVLLMERATGWRGVELTESAALAESRGLLVFHAAPPFPLLEDGDDPDTDEDDPPDMSGGQPWPVLNGEATSVGVDPGTGPDFSARVLVERTRGGRLAAERVRREYPMSDIAPFGLPWLPVRGDR